MASENGTLAKLAEIRQHFMADFHQEAARFRNRVQELREGYLNEIVDLTLTDAKVTEVQRTLDLLKPPTEKLTAASVPEQTEPLPKHADVLQPSATTLAPPEKQPMKTYRMNVYGRCHACNAPIFEAQAKFCSQCAYPLDE
jgi:hypothetical protein